MYSYNIFVHIYLHIKNYLLLCFSFNLKRKLSFFLSFLLLYKRFNYVAVESWGVSSLVWDSQFSKSASQWAQMNEGILVEAKVAIVFLVMSVWGSLLDSTRSWGRKVSRWVCLYLQSWVPSHFGSNGAKCCTST